MKTSSASNATLVCTLGTTAPVISETLTLLWDKGKVVDKLVIIHTNWEQVFSKQTSTGKNIGLDGFQTWLKNRAGPTSIELECRNLNIQDVVTVEDNDLVLKTTLEVLAKERAEGRSIYLSIAGGRKTMSAMALFAAYVTGCDGIFHVLVNGDEAQLTKQYGFDVPKQYLYLVEIPLINLSPLLATVLSQIDADNRFRGDFYRYLEEGEDIGRVFQECNAQLLSILDERRLREEYQRRFPAYEKMCFVAQEILRTLAKSLDIRPRPIIEGRVKTFDSLKEKIVRKQQEGNRAIKDPFEEIQDIAGARVVCFFDEDVRQLREKIETEFSVEEIVEITSTAKKKTVMERHGEKTTTTTWTETPKIGYSAFHYIVTLPENRLELPEYGDLRGVRCEIQVKTILDHAWSQVEHGLRYKSEDYKRAPDPTRDEVDNAFMTTSVLLNKAKEQFSEIRQLYQNASVNPVGGDSSGGTP